MKLRNIILCSIACLLCIGTVARSSADSPQAPAGSAPAGAHMQMEVASHDFGDIERKGGDLVCEFTYLNDGTAPLVITRIITSCSCLKASFSKRPVQPGQSGVIRITYEPHKKEPGAFNKVIQIYSNSIDGRNLITVKGNSLEQPPRKIKTDEVKMKFR